MNNFTPKDIVAVVSLVSILVYKALGHNGGFDAIITLIIGYYFGRRDDPTLQLPSAMVKAEEHNVILNKG